MPKNVLDDISFEGLGLLMFLIREKDKNNTVCMGYREIARRTGKSDGWVRAMIKTFTKKHIVNADKNAPRYAAKSVLKIGLSIISNADENAPQNAGSDLTFEKVWKAYGRIGSKKLAKERYDRLPQNKKEALLKSIPYYRAFHNPSYFAHLSTYISEEKWNSVETYEGVAIPKENYHIANADSFVVWFNKKVQGSGIPQISELTPARYRMLNICYTLCYDLMKKVMDILLSNDRYTEMANKGMITFDKIFEPANMRRICEQGGNI